MSDILGGRYRIVSVVGRGGEATVLQAIDTRHERPVALKVRPMPADETEAQAQLAEARLLLSLPAHEGLAHARDDFYDSSRHVLVLDWVDGIDVARVLAGEGSPGLPLTSVLRWLAQAADALTALHQHGIVHGDVKPANLVLDQHGRIVVVDLGSSSVPGRLAPGGGTPGFRAPELATGDPPTRASDVYGLAATAFALLTGSAPVGVLPDWEQLEPARARVLEDALRAGLSLAPERRPSTPGELVERLRAGGEDRVPTGVVTVLLTDVVGSTELWSRLPRDMPGVLARMQLAVDVAVEQRGGVRIGATVEGDATVSGFARAGDALEAAVAVQRALQSDSSTRPAPSVRIGLATGEVTAVGLDVAGPTLSRAARVRDLAGAGEIFLSETTARVLAPALPDGISLVALGPHALRGLEERDEVCAVAANGIVTPPDPGRSPYPGLAPFGADDAAFYVGREVLVTEALERLRGEGFVGLVGASGTGKSSLALAGLGPQLADVAVLTPRDHPMAALQAVAGDASRGAVLIVDQLEEVVTLCRDRDEQAVFLDAVATHERVVVTLRSDVYGELAGFGRFSSLLAASHLLVGSPSVDELRRAIIEPAARCGLRVERGLVEVILGDLGTEPGRLPLLAHALRETWERRDGRCLTLAGYQAAGRVDGAIAIAADSVIDAMADDQRELAREALLGMVDLRDDGDDARRWVSLADLDPSRRDGTRQALDALADARLVVIEADRATLAHETLLSAWPRLRAWVDEERVGLLARQQVRRAAATWVDGGRSPADLYRGARLAGALGAIGAAAPSADVAVFLEASRAHEERQLATARRTTRRLRGLLAGVSVFAAVALVAGLLAWAARSRAADERDAADLARLVALVGATRAVQPDLAMLLAVAAHDQADSAQTRGALVDSLTARPALRALLQGSPTTVEAVAMSPSGDRLAASSRGTIRMWSTEDWTVDREVVIGDGQIFALDFTEQGESLVAAIPDDLSLVQISTGGDVVAQVELDPMRAVGLDVEGDRVWVQRDDFFDPAAVPFAEARAAGSLEVVSPPLYPGSGRLTVVAASGEAVALGADDGSIWVGDARTGEVVPFAGPPLGIDVDVSAISWDGDAIVAGRANGSVDVWPSSDGSAAQLVVLDAGAPVDSVATTEDGDVVSAGTEDGRLVVWDAATGERRLDVPAAHNGQVNAVAFTRGGREVVSGGFDGKAAVYATDGNLAIASLAHATPGPGHGTYAPDGQRRYFAWASDDGGAIVRTDRDATEASWMTVTPGPVNAVAATDTRVIATVQPGGSSPDADTPSVWVLDARTGDVLSRHLVPHALNLALAVAPDGERVWVAAAMPDGSEVFAVDLENGASSQPAHLDEQITSVVVLPGGRRLATGGFDGDVAVRDADDLRVIRRSEQVLDEVVTAVAVDPGGTLLTAAGLAGPIRVFDVATMRPRYEPLDGHRSLVSSVAVAPEGTIVSASTDGTVRLWDGQSGDPIGGPIPTGGADNPSVSIDPSTSRALVQGATGLLEINLRPEDWTSAACRIAGRQLSEAETARMLIDDRNVPCRRPAGD